MQTDQIDRWLGKPEVARLFGVTSRSIDNWVSKGRFPRPDRLPNGYPAWRESIVRGAVTPSQSAA